MRNRSFTALDLVGLPLADARELVTLAHEVDAAAPIHDDDKPFRSKLPKMVQSALSDLSDARIALQAELDKEPPPPPGRREADRLEDNTVLALVEVLGGWARLAGQLPLGDDAQRLFRRLFGEGSTDFVNFPVKKEWAVVQGKLDVIKDEGLASEIAKLGAAPILTELHRVHKAYGIAVGTTQAPRVVETAQLVEKRAELSEALRTYIVRVVATRDRKDPSTLELSDRLLRPLIEWESKPTAASKATPPAAAGVEAPTGPSGNAPPKG